MPHQPFCPCCHKRGMLTRINRKIKLKELVKIRLYTESNIRNRQELKKKEKSVVLSYNMPFTSLNFSINSIEESPRVMRSKKAQKKARQRLNKALKKQQMVPAPQEEEKNENGAERTEPFEKSITANFDSGSNGMPQLSFSSPTFVENYEPPARKRPFVGKAPLFRKAAVPPTASSRPGPVEKKCLEKKNGMMKATKSVTGPKKETTKTISKTNPPKLTNTQKRRMKRLRALERAQALGSSKTCSEEENRCMSPQEQNKKTGNRSSSAHVDSSNGTAAVDGTPAASLASPTMSGAGPITFSEVVSLPKKVPSKSSYRFTLPPFEEEVSQMKSICHKGPQPKPRMSPTRPEPSAAEKKNDVPPIPAAIPSLVPKPEEHKLAVTPLIPLNVLLGPEEELHKAQEILFDEYRRLIPGHEFLFPKKDQKSVDVAVRLEYGSLLDEATENLKKMLDNLGLFEEE